MSTIVERYKKIQLNISSLKTAKPVNIIAVSKTFNLEHIRPLIEYGHVHFGENKVQEATTKWFEQKEKNPNLKLHMIGKLQRIKLKTQLNYLIIYILLITKNLQTFLQNIKRISTEIYNTLYK